MTQQRGRSGKIGKSLINWVKEINERYAKGRSKLRGQEAWRSCISKIRWPTEYQARKAKTINEKRYGETFKVYHCGYCLGYHLAKRKKK